MDLAQARMLANMAELMARSMESNWCVNTVVAALVMMSAVHMPDTWENVVPNHPRPYVHGPVLEESHSA